METALTESIARDGQTATTAVIPFASGVKTDTIVEKTSNTGVTIDSVLIKDGRVDTAKGSDIASATTTDIGAATGNYALITGTTTISGLGTITAGNFRFVQFDDALTLTHNGTSLILPGAANITTVAGDVAGFVSLGSGNWKCLFYQKISGAIGSLVDDLTPQLGGPLDTNSQPVRFAKGGDLASASPLVIDTDGQYFDVTGTTGFSAMTVDAGLWFMLQFNGALTMTDGASLDLGGANITTAAGDRGLFYATAANTVQMISYQREGVEPMVFATQAQQETGTAVNVAVPPGRQHNHPGHPKGWVTIDGDASPADSVDSYNVTSVTDNGTGDYTVTWATDFSNTTYAVALANRDTSAAPVGNYNRVKAKAAGTIQVEHYETTGPTLTDVEELYVAAFGDQ